MQASQSQSVLSTAGLRQLEELLHEVGSDTSVLHTTQSRGTKPKTSSPIGNANYKSRRDQDCLSAGSRLRENSHLSPASTISKTNNTSIKGISFAGKANLDTLYLGHGFDGPSRESPGPIYQPISTLDTTHGQSFTKAQRVPGSHHRSVSNGPDVLLPSSIGSQSLSTNASPSNAVFSKAERWKPRGKTNMPIAYQTQDSTNDKKSFSFGNSKTVAANKIFISRGHIADSQGLDSPGPKYFLEDPFTKGGDTDKKAFIALKSHYDNAPSFSFASKKHLEERDNSDKPPRPKSVEPTSVPGPGQYAPDYSLVEPSAPAMSFPKQRAHSASHVTKTQPGPSNPSNALSFLDKHTPSASWGNTQESVDRMSEKMYLGKGMETGRGKDSPGPAYNPIDTTLAVGKGKGISISFKEKSVSKRLRLGPDRARFISRELAKENLGTFSPGPKYLPGPNPGWDRAPAVTFGVSDRYFNDSFSPEHKAKFGTAEKPYVSPGQARFVSLLHSKMSLCGMASPGPKGNPSIESTSKFKSSVAVGIAPPPSSEQKDDNKISSYNPTFKQLDPSQHVHSFGKAKRMLDTGGPGIPGPGQYQPNYSQVETKVPDVAIGIL